VEEYIGRCEVYPSSSGCLPYSLVYQGSYFSTPHSVWIILGMMDKQMSPWLGCSFSKFHLSEGLQPIILYASKKFYAAGLYPADICSPITPSTSPSKTSVSDFAGS
jgi:hypothetical protein